MTNYQIVRCTPERQEEAIALLTRLWSTDIEVNRRYWAWKYDRNPTAGDQRIYLALEGGRVIGMRGFIGALWEYGVPPSTAWAPCAGDTVVAREHEGHGVFRAIMEVAEAELRAAGHSFMFNFSAGPTVFLRSLRGGWQAVGSFDAWHRRGSLAGSANAGGDPFALRGTGRDSTGTRLDDGIIVGDVPRAEDMAALVRRVPRSGRIRRVRDATYFGWRFDNPLSRYRFLYRMGAELDGYVVVRTKRYAATDRVTIIDAEAASPHVLTGLLDATVRVFGSWPLSIWAASLGAETREHLRGLGFADPPRPSPPTRHRRALLVKATDPQRLREQWMLGSRSVLDPENWDLRLVWSDGV